MKHQIPSRPRNHLSTKSDGDTYTIPSKFCVCFSACRRRHRGRYLHCKGQDDSAIVDSIFAGFLIARSSEWLAYITADTVTGRLYSNVKYRQFQREVTRRSPPYQVEQLTSNS